MATLPAPEEQPTREDRMRRSVGQRDPKDARRNDRSNGGRVNAMPGTTAAAATSACAAMPGDVATRRPASWRRPVASRCACRPDRRFRVPPAPCRVARPSSGSGEPRPPSDGRARIGPATTRSRKTGLPTPFGRQSGGPARRKFPLRAAGDIPGRTSARTPDQELCEWILQ